MLHNRRLCINERPARTLIALVHRVGNGMAAGACVEAKGEGDTVSNVYMTRNYRRRKKIALHMEKVACMQWSWM